jgi:hypothetical protein
MSSQSSSLWPNVKLGGQPDPEVQMRQTIDGPTVGLR